MKFLTKEHKVLMCIHKVCISGLLINMEIFLFKKNYNLSSWALRPVLAP